MLHTFSRSADGIEIVSSYMYDDGDEALGNDVFEREPFLVKFHVKPAGKIVYDLVNDKDD